MNRNPSSAASTTSNTGASNTQTNSSSLSSSNDNQSSEVSVQIWNQESLNSLDRVLAQIRAQTERRYERARLGLPEEEDPDIMAEDI